MQTDYINELYIKINHNLFTLLPFLSQYSTTHSFEIPYSTIPAEKHKLKPI